MRLEVTHWRGKVVSEMSREELIDALSDAHDLWRTSNESRISDMMDRVRPMGFWRSLFNF